MILGLISGLMLDVYYANIAVLLVPLLESLEGYWRGISAAHLAGICSCCDRLAKPPPAFSQPICSTPSPPWSPFCPR